MEDNFDVSVFVKDIIEVELKKDKKRLYRKKYYQKNKDKRKQYRQKNKKEIAQQKAEYYQKNKKQILQYYQTPEGIKSHRINSWKCRGVICDNWDALYDHYTKTAYCDFCRVELSTDKERSSTTKCLDHDHSITDRPNFRNILCHKCNVLRK